MTGTDFVVIGIVAVVIVLAIGYIIKAKKSGAKCIGCPADRSCGSCNCACQNENK